MAITRAELLKMPVKLIMTPPRSPVPWYVIPAVAVGALVVTYLRRKGI